MKFIILLMVLSFNVNAGWNSEFEYVMWDGEIVPAYTTPDVQKTYNGCMRQGELIKYFFSLEPKFKTTIKEVRFKCVKIDMV